MSGFLSYGTPALFVDGEWITRTPQMAPVHNPATGEEIGRHPIAEPEHIERALAAAQRGFDIWRRTPLDGRQTVLRRAAALLRERSEEAARHLTIEMGKILGDARAEIENCAGLLEWCADAAAEPAGRPLPDRPGFVQQKVVKEPIGPVAAFAPWNFPASLGARKIASALAVGCSVIVKPAEEAPCALLPVVRALDDAGLPAGVVNLLIGNPARISEMLIRSPVIRKVAFTGSTPVGKLLAAMAGSEAKPCVLELGGHAPVLVFADADIDRAIALSVVGKARNSGQVCISPTRFFIEDPVFDRFAAGLASGLAALKVGDGLDPETRMGPLINQKRVDAVDALVQDAVGRGARLLTGGVRPNRPGFFYPPTVIADVPADARIMREEPFGPVAIVNRFSSIDEAIERANETDYALAAYAFASSAATKARVAAEVDAGMVGVNGFAVVMLDSPLGGRKASGYGSEGGIEGLDAYRTTKFVSEATV